MGLSATNIIKLVKNEEIIEVKVRPKSNAKSIIVRISFSKGVELTLPKGASINKAYDFLLKKEEWIRQRLVKFTRYTPAIGDIIPIFGKSYVLVHDNTKSEYGSYIEGNKLIVSGPEDMVSHHASQFLRMMIRREILEYVDQIYKTIGVKYNKVSIRDQISRWGSCSSTGNLSFSWRLIFAPKSIMQYVVVHELCHLLEMNHSKRFWQLVKKACPDYKTSESWLKNNGNTLHRYFATKK